MPELYRFRNFYIPARMMGGIERYINKGIMPGDFLSSVIENNLSNAVDHADGENLANLPAYIGYFYNNAPADCWGSVKRVKEWSAAGGSEGKFGEKRK